MIFPSRLMTERKQYTSHGQCIYCMEHFPKLTEEHIIPESLQGSWVVTGACEECAKRSNKEYEQGVLQSDMVRTMRAFLALRRKKGKKKPPIPMPPLFTHGTASKTLIEDEDYYFEDDAFYPRILFMVALELPLKLDATNSGDLERRPIRLWMRNVENPLHPGPIVLTDPAPVLSAYTSTKDFMLAADLSIGERNVSVRQRIPLNKFMRMLAKIAYCFAVAEHGVEKYKDSTLRKLVIGERDDLHNFIGGSLNGETLTRRNLHHIAFRQRGDFNTVLVHLFSSYRAPAYEVVIDDIT